MRRIAFLAVLSFLSLAARADVWIADRQAIHRIDTARFTIEVSVPLAGVRALAVDPTSGAAWALSGEVLTRWSRDGQSQLEKRLSPVGDESNLSLTVDVTDGSLLIAGTRSTGPVTHRIDSEGNVVNALAGTRTGEVTGPVYLGMAKDAEWDRSWGVTADRLVRIEGGAPASVSELSPLQLGRATAVQFDPSNRVVVVGLEQGIARFDAAGQNPTLLRTPLPTTLVAAPAMLVSHALSLESPEPGSVTKNNRPTIVLKAGTACSGRPCEGVKDFAEGLKVTGTANGSALQATRPALDKFVMRPDRVLPDGEVTIEAVAIDAQGVPSPEFSQSFRIDTTPPSILAVTPPNGFVTDLKSAVISGRLSEPALLTLNGDSVPVTGDRTFSVEKNLAMGLNSFELRALDPAGNPSSMSLKVTRVASGARTSDKTGGGAPQVTITSPTDGEQFTMPDAIPVIAEARVGNVFIPVSVHNDSPAGFDVILDPPNSTTETYPSSPPVNLYTWTGVPEGTYQIVASANGVSTSITIAVVNPIQLAITSPANGASISGSMVTVTGTISGVSNVGVTVNGMAASVFGNQFVATLPIPTGTVQLDVVATAQSGVTRHTSVTVTSPTSARLVELTIEPPVGIAPFTATVTAPLFPPEMPGGLIEVDFDGDGQVYEAPLNYPGQQVSHTYATPGVYNAKARMWDYGAGAYVYWDLPVVVQDVLTLDAKLKGVISGMLERIAARDVPGALQALTPQAAEHFRPGIEAMSALYQPTPSGPPVEPPPFGTVATSFITNSFAEYIVMRERVPGQKRAYFIYLMRGPDGVWRISQL
ncbi:hypothetical protein BWI17_14595 [Betaproteobacteria bacterium GR16-43]|nr:hypothetical protein BWI17_14595 [Betaproteobacteria bacterium GR16-43]